MVLAYWMGNEGLGKSDHDGGWATDGRVFNVSLVWAPPIRDDSGRVV
jgi:hypothetical protein